MAGRAGLRRRQPSPGAPPRHGTVHGRDEVVPVTAEAFRHREGKRSGQALVDALRSAPRGRLDFALASAPMPVRGVRL